MTDPDTCDHEPAPRIVPPLGHPLSTCAKCGIVYMPDDDDLPPFSEEVHDYHTSQGD